MTPRSLLELNIMGISSEIRRKPNWYKKIFDQTITDKWRNELANILIFRDHPITPEIINYIFDELKWLANNQNPSNGIIASPVDGVYESFHQIP
jgi:hypothetical protein